MMRAGPDTRTQIMDAAQDLILENGFAGTSVDAILARVQLTKGAFFHHFRSKTDLAHALVERFAAEDASLLARLLEQSERLGRDPVQRLLLLVGLLEEETRELAEPHPGCLFASYCYEAQIFDPEIHAIIRRSFELWREGLGERIREAAAFRAPRLEVDADDVADALMVVAEGAFILSRAMRDPQAVARQLRQYRNYLELLFAEA